MGESGRTGGARRWRGAGIAVALAAGVTASVLVGGPSMETLRLPDGSERHYVLIAPKDDGAPRPLVVLLHEEYGSPQAVLGVSGMAQAAREQGFFLAVPAGSPPVEGGAAAFGAAVWNAEFCCGLPAARHVDDVAFIREVIAAVEAAHPVDRDRVFLVGYRTGAALAERAACAIPEVDGVAVVATDNAGPACDPGRPLPIVAIHGLDDPCAPIGGGAACGGCAERFGQQLLGMVDPSAIPSWRCASLPDHLAPWRRAAGCSDRREVAHEEPGARCYAYEGCTPAAAVTACELERQGHLWPGIAICANGDSGLCRLTRRVYGPVESDFDVASYVWRVLSAHLP